MKLLKRIFLTGLAAVIPIVITTYIIIGLFIFADNVLGKLLDKLLEKYLGVKVPGLVIIVSILLIFVLGLLIQLSRMRLAHLAEALFLRMPLVNKIYFPIRRMVNFLFFPPHRTFRRAVLVQYPRKGLYSIGFITNETPPEFTEKIDKRFYNIFIPSSPSPLTGFTIIVAEEDIIFLDIGVEEAIKLIVSGGLLNPYER